VHANKCCRIIENDLFKQDWRSRGKTENAQYMILKWTIALLIGLGTGLVAFFNNIGVENIAGFKLLLTNDLMLNHKYVFYNIMLRILLSIITSNLE
jgi:chloride channel 7